MNAVANPVYKDSTGREWKLVLNIGVIEDIKTQTGYDFGSYMLEPEKLANLLIVSPKILAEILYLICEEQVLKLELDGREFGRSLDRETMDKATDALITAIVIFFQRGSAGQTLREKLPLILEKMDTQIRRRVSRSLDKALSDMDIDSGEQLELIPARLV